MCLSENDSFIERKEMESKHIFLTEDYNTAKNSSIIKTVYSSTVMSHVFLTSGTF